MDRVQRKRSFLSDHLTDLSPAENWSHIVAAQVMTPSPVCIRPDATFSELLDLLHTNRFRHFLVTDPEGKLLGVVSDRDVLRLMGRDPRSPSARERLDQTLAGEWMSHDVIAVFPGTPLIQVVRTVLHYGISCVPVVEAGFPIGIITSTDLYLLLEMILVGPIAVSQEYAHVAQRLGTLGEIARGTKPETLPQPVASI